MRKGDPDQVPDPAIALSGASDLAGLVIGLAAWLVLILLTPVLVVLLAWVLLPLELILLLVLAALVLMARFSGLVPWTVEISDPLADGATHEEKFRNIFRAVSRVREINHDRRVRVRWSWT